MTLAAKPLMQRAKLILFQSHYLLYIPYLENIIIRYKHWTNWVITIAMRCNRTSPVGIYG